LKRDVISRINLISKTIHPNIIIITTKIRTAATPVEKE